MADVKQGDRVRLSLAWIDSPGRRRSVASWRGTVLGVKPSGIVRVKWDHAKTVGRYYYEFIEKVPV